MGLTDAMAFVTSDAICFISVNVERTLDVTQFFCLLHISSYFVFFHLQDDNGDRKDPGDNKYTAWSYTLCVCSRTVESWTRHYHRENITLLWDRPWGDVQNNCIYHQQIACRCVSSLFIGTAQIANQIRLHMSNSSDIFNEIICQT